MEHDAESSKRYKENWDDAVQASKADAAEIAELKAAYALLFKAHAAERKTAEANAATIDRLHDRLRQIGDRAHDASTGPALPDVLREIRSMAYDGIGA